ncbi:MAG: SAP domain-containing protein [Candidatus Thermoplasmatota archaeon]|nr:SAP domain-containing protein [Candidatus Thermoplasmatota archaeon]MED5159145.1 SAP domain-containing protein [Candidatus Thermoplasmatota archaeon]MEE3232515.1 SAP domain-containing protein [Candidatus Thermoplasmatota archaeon]|tara:strand:+ start:888 stop:1808 length:921 start_codon:yes stop_codon:yes gene_type:complete
MAKGAAARAAARRQRDKWKSKRWYTIRAPRHPWAFKVIGETIAEDESMLIGRNYEILQNELDGDFSKMHVKVQFRISGVVGGDALTEYIGHEMLKDHIRRQVRRDRGKIDDTVDIVTEDGFYVRIKPLLISRNRIKGSQKQEMRTLAREVILKTGATTTWIDLQKSSLDGTLEAKIREEVSKIQPVRGVMIRRTQLIQTGVVTQDGPTLEEIRNQEEAEKEAAAETEDLDSAEETESPEQEEESEAEAEEDAIVPESVEEDAAEPEAVSDEVDYSSMTVAQLKDLLREAGKTVSGKKAELIERLQE